MKIAVHPDRRLDDVHQLHIALGPRCFKALARSGLLIIPAQASEPDLREALVVVSDIRTRLTDYADAELERKGLPLFRTTLVERSAYREMFLSGQPPTITEPERGPARWRSCMNPRHCRAAGSRAAQGRLTMKPRTSFQPLVKVWTRRLKPAREKGVGALVKPAHAEPELSSEAKPKIQATAEPALPRTPMKALNVELPDYVWTALKIRPAERQTSVRHVIMTALRSDGISIAEPDMIDASRRVRGSQKAN